MGDKDKQIVISGINLFQGGPLRVYYDYLDAILGNRIYEEYRFVLFVHSKELFSKYEQYFEIIELPKARKSFVFRLYYEYVWFYKFSKKRKIYAWVSLHDITPNVDCKHRFVYCHNPLVFQDNELRITNIKRIIYSALYNLLYRTNIKKNDYVIVQANWIKREFIERYRTNNIIVARPETRVVDYADSSCSSNNIFIYPAFPREFKNFEVICKASKELLKRGIDDFSVFLTIDGGENEYAFNLVKEYKELKVLQFIGQKSFHEIEELYSVCNYMIFPSKLETWGLPLSEFKKSNKPILLADKPYAHETLGKYEKVKFFDCTDSIELANCMYNLITQNIEYDTNEDIVVEGLFAANWNELINLIYERL